jgi:hypothetical protein
MSRRTKLPWTLPTDWEHQFEPKLPPCAQVSRSEAVLHPSEHSGDGSQHNVVRVPVRDTSRSHRVWSASQPASSVAAPPPMSTAIRAVLR